VVQRISSQTETWHGVGGRVGNLPQNAREGKLDYLASSWCFSVFKNLQMRMRGPSWEAKFSPLQTVMSFFLISIKEMIPFKFRKLSSLALAGCRAGG